MLIVGYCFDICSEWRLCEEVHLNLACRWFCRLGLDGSVPDHSTFAKNHHGRFRESDVLRRLSETVLPLRVRHHLEGPGGGRPDRHAQPQDGFPDRDYRKSIVVFATDTSSRNAGGIAMLPDWCAQIADALLSG